MTAASLAPIVESVTKRNFKVKLTCQAQVSHAQLCATFTLTLQSALHPTNTHLSLCCNAMLRFHYEFAYFFLCTLAVTPAEFPRPQVEFIQQIKFLYPQAYDWQYIRVPSENEKNKWV